MSIRAFGTELDSPCEDAATLAMTNAAIPPTFPRIRESLDEEGEEEEESIGGREHGGTSSIAGTGGVTTDSDRNDDDYTTMTSITTPSSKRNKRKMTEPRRRRTDFSIRSLCSNSDDEELGTRTEETPSKRTKRFREEEENVLKPSPSSASTLILPPPGSTYTTASSLLGPFALDPSVAPFGRRQGPRPDTPSTADPPFPFDFAPSRRPPRKNYKNMTKQRRIEANARERTRVHTISAAFESLRRAVPSYSYNQRLSKLAILRIASSYILALATLAELDYGGGGGGGQRGQTFGDCVDLCTQTIQAEGRAKRRH